MKGIVELLAEGKIGDVFNAFVERWPEPLTQREVSVEADTNLVTLRGGCHYMQSLMDLGYVEFKGHTYGTSDNMSEVYGLTIKGLRLARTVQGRIKPKKSEKVWMPL